MRVPAVYTTDIRISQYNVAYFLYREYYTNRKAVSFRLLLTSYIRPSEMSKVLFDGSDRIKDDPCAQKAKLRQNEATNCYQISNLRGNDVCRTNGKVDKFASQHKNLRPWQGYGWDRCRVDVDSRLRNDQIWTNDPWKTQWDTRTFVAVPDLGRGRPMPETESRLINGQDTTSSRQCGSITEKQFDNVFHPTVLPVCPEHIIPSWTWGGESSRDINRSPEFMKSLGYEYDGRMWVRTC